MVFVLAFFVVVDLLGMEFFIPMKNKSAPNNDKLYKNTTNNKYTYFKPPFKGYLDLYLERLSTLHLHIITSEIHI